MATDKRKIEPVHLLPGFFGTVGYEPGTIPGRNLPDPFPDDVDALPAPQPATGTDLKNLQGPQSYYVWRGHGPARLAEFDPRHIGRDRGYEIRNDPGAGSWCGEVRAEKPREG